MTCSVNPGNRSCLNYGFVKKRKIPYQGSMHETVLQNKAGIMVASGVKSCLKSKTMLKVDFRTLARSTHLFPKAPIIATTPYGVHAITNKKKIVKEAFAMRISTEVAFISLFAANDATFILRA